VFLALCRHFRPAPYQVLQEVTLRVQRGEAVDTEAALQPEAAKPARSRMDLAMRLRQRKERQRQGRVMYSGFVPPYNTQSRVFDANELRRAATQVGYTISPSGDMQVPVQPAPSGVSSHGSGVVGTIMALTRRHSSVSAVASTTGALPPFPSSSGAAAGAEGVPRPYAAYYSAGITGDGSSTAGVSTPAAGSVVGAHEALPPVEGFVPNPVLANLERAFTADPRRHKRNDSQASQSSLISSIAK
jgi:hypothetical protein